MHILTIVGARPQLIKAALVSAALAKQNLSEHILHTGQHFDYRMSEVFFDELNLPTPTWHLGLGGLSHGAMTGRMLEHIEAILQTQKPRWVLVYGDTNSTLAGALAAAKLGIPVAHVEAGMRSFNRQMPEEINRILTDHLATLLFVTSASAADLLLREGISQGIHTVGDVMYDAVLHFRSVAKRTNILDHLGLYPKRYALVTVHRQENTDHPERLVAICTALNQLAKEMPLVFPLHPRTRQRLEAAGISLDASILQTEPLSYLEMLALEEQSRIILTDSGGIQKEALYLGVPCITLRDETEWTETVAAGWNYLTGVDSNRIQQAVERILGKDWQTPPPQLYGDGKAATKIASILAET